MNKNNFAVIMAGGIGSRFWPMSRTAFPKQFLDILNTGKSLLQSTYDRFSLFIPNENIFIVTSDEYISIVQTQLPGIPVKNIVGETERKNTAPCIALIAMKLRKLNPDANLIVAPSDHMIDDTVAFENNCLQALAFTETNDCFVTLGIKPTYANTGYGYIQYKTNQNKGNNIFPVERFTEKPNQQIANEFINDGTYVWNSGIFIWKAKDILNAFQIYMPNLYELFSKELMDLNTGNELASIRRIFKNCESISIDYAILEKAKNVFMIRADFDWSDLGTWNSAWENFNKDATQNAVSGTNTLLVDVKGSIVHSTDKKLIVVGGVEDLIIVNTPDALLICKKENEQQIKEYLALVKESKGELYL